MSEITKLYKIAGIELVADVKFPTKDVNYNVGYPPFTAEKQINIENVILQNRSRYLKWFHYSINKHGKWVVGFIEQGNNDIVSVTETREEAFAHVINELWVNMSEEEKQQIKEILGKLQIEK